MKKILDVLSKDKKLKKIIDDIGTSGFSKIKLEKNIGSYLVDSIISQQISTKAADAISKRFWKKIGRNSRSMVKIRDTEIDSLRECGLSFQKANYVKNIANFWLENKLSDKDLINLNNAEIISLLTQIKGVGQWTAEMVLIFGLGREDVFSSGDLGIQMAMKKHYSLKMEGRELKTKMEKLAVQWLPYRSMACLLLWGSHDKTK